MSLVVGLVVGMAVFMFMWGWREYRKPSPVKERAKTFGADPKAEAAIKPSYYQRRLRPLARRLGPRLRFLQPVLQPTAVDKHLVYAGYPAGLETPDDVLGLQALGGIFLFALFGSLMLSGELVAFFLAGFMMLAGLYWPIIWLSARATERQRKITLAVPDMLDLLTICVEAGLGFDLSLEHILEKMSGALADEMRLFMRELHMGVPRAEAFARLRERTNSQELHTLIDALVQGHELGVPIAKTLEEQAGDMRIRRLQRAREQGAQASPKISLVTTILVAPSIMCVFLAVVIFYVVGEISAGFGGGIK
jgi:tight adherence protein C